MKRYRFANPDDFALWLWAKNISRRRLTADTGISRTQLFHWERSAAPITRRSARRLTEAGVPRELLVAL